MMISWGFFVANWLVNLPPLCEVQVDTFTGSATVVSSSGARLNSVCPSVSRWSPLLSFSRASFVFLDNSRSGS